MLIDWFTVAAQVVNFLILVWLLKRFLYGRILRAIEAREQGIAERLAAADAKDKAAAEQLALYQAKLQEFEDRHQELLAQAKQEAEQQQAQMMAEARERVHALEADWQADLDRERNAFLADLRRKAAAEILALARQTVADLDRERNAFLADLRRKAAAEILALARQAVADLACVDIQRCAIEVFLEKIRELDAGTCQSLARSALTIRTAFDLPEALRAEVEQAVRDRVGTPAAIAFERAAGIGLGIELCGNGWRIGWNSESYMETLEEDLRETLEQRDAAAAGAHAGAR